MVKSRVRARSIPQVAVLEGMVIPRGDRQVHVGGRQVSGRLLDLLQQRGYAVSRGVADIEAVRGLKESLCYVAQDIQRDSRVGCRSSSSS